MFDWLTRRKAVVAAPTPARPAGPPAEPPSRERTAPAAGPAAAEVPAADADHGLWQRWPLVNTRGKVAGFELAMPASLRERLLAAEARNGGAGAAAQVAHQVALVTSARLLAADGRQALVALPGHAFGHPALAAAVGPRVLLAWAGAAPHDDAVRALRSRGAAVGPADTPPGTEAAADFALLRCTVGGIDTALAAAGAWRSARPAAQIVVTGLGDVGEIEQVLRAGADLASGRLDGRRAARTRGPSPGPAVQRLVRLMNHLAQDSDTTVVADAVRADVALAYRLLRFANSAAIGLRRGVDSVEQAVSVLGRDHLRRWLSVMLLTAGASRPASAALQEHALTRGLLLEALAREAGLTAPDAMFAMGLLSQLDLLLQIPLAEALEPLHLSADCRAALLQGTGPWAPYLAVATALDGDDMAALDAAATPFGGAARVLAAAQNAWSLASGLLVAAAPDEAGSSTP